MCRGVNPLKNATFYPDSLEIELPLINNVAENLRLWKTRHSGRTLQKILDTCKSRGDLNSLKDATLGGWQTKTFVEIVGFCISVAEHSVLKNATLRFPPRKRSFSLENAWKGACWHFVSLLLTFPKISRLKNSTKHSHHSTLKTHLTSPFDLDTRLLTQHCY